MKTFVSILIGYLIGYCISNECINQLCIIEQYEN
jgi:hypothetical protein